MPKDAAIKNAARKRQAETGESYTEARAAVVAEHDKPIVIQLTFEGIVEFKLDTPEARKAWRELPPARVRTGDTEPLGVDPAEAYDFAREYLGNGFAQMLVDSIEYDGATVDIQDPTLGEINEADATDPVAVSDVGRWYR